MFSEEDEERYQRNAQNAHAPGYGNAMKDAACTRPLTPREHLESEAKNSSARATQFTAQARACLEMAERETKRSAEFSQAANRL